MVNLQEIFKLIESKRKTHLPWKRDEAVPQPHFTYSPSSQSWEATTTPPPTTATLTPTFNVLSWNIDFMLPHPDERMTAALAHLHTLTTSSPHPSVIFLAETLESDLALLRASPWVQSHYHLTDLDATYWESGHYGTVVLIPHALPVHTVFRVHYSATKQERDAMFVDIALAPGRVLRLCTTHLESLIADPPLRPAQVALAARWLAPEGGVVGGVMGGDFNAIQPFDRTLHAENGLRDAFLETGGREDEEAGYTWGQMAPVKQREMFGCSRMDKFFVGGVVEVLNFERFGLGVKVGVKEVEETLVADEGMDGGYVTDHAGVWGTFRVSGQQTETQGAKI